MEERKVEKESTKIVHDMCYKIWGLMCDIGKEITEATSRSEADILLGMVRTRLDNHMADEIWDHYVDWEKVTWK